jgi:hypothetical protein
MPANELVKWNLITYAGKLPEKVFRYRHVTHENIDRLINFEILEEGIYLAGLKDLNDPNEGRFIFKFDGTEDEIFAYWMSRLQNASLAKTRTKQVLDNNFSVPDEVVEYTRYVLGHVMRVACFTIHPTNNAMWAHYAKYSDPATKPIDHGGICIEYECDEGWRDANFHPVEYSDDIPVINVLTMHKEESKAVRAMYLKSPEWQYENEWRIATTLQCQPPFPANLTVNSKIVLENGVKSVIFGLNTPDGIIERFKEQIMHLKPNMVFKQVKRDSQTLNIKILEI